MSNNVVEIVEEGSTVVEVVAQGPQGPSGTGFGTVELAAASTELTTIGNQIVICNNTDAAIVTLNTSPNEGEQVHIKRRAGPVTVAGVIDGITDRIISGPTDAPFLVFSSITNDWNIL